MAWVLISAPVGSLETWAGWCGGCPNTAGQDEKTTKTNAKNTRTVGNLLPNWVQKSTRNRKKTRLGPKRATSILIAIYYTLAKVE